MRTVNATPGRLFASTLLGLALVFTAPAPAADAHGGKFKPPPPKHEPGNKGRMPGRVPRDPPTPPHKPRVPTKPPTTKPPSTPKPTPGVPPDTGTPGRKPLPPTTPPPTKPKVPDAKNPTTPQPELRKPRPPHTGRKTGNKRRGRGGAGASPEMSWEMWWDLNRWKFFPDRGDVLKPSAVTTPSADAEPAIDRKAVAAQRRDMVSKRVIVPFLLDLLKPTTRVRDEVRSASMIALAKINHDDPSIAMIFKYAEDPKASGLVRESAALAIGMMRRGEKKMQRDGKALDAARGRLIALVDDDKAPDRTRAFAALAIGMLGDQPFGSAFTKDGRMVTRELWQRAIGKYNGRELPVALLTAIGMQPQVGTAAEIKTGLTRIVHGRRVGRRSWDNNERSHALMALIRQEGDGWPIALCRVLTAKRIPADVRRSAFIALGAKSGALSAEGRMDAAGAVDAGLRLSRDNLTRGLGLIALGRLIASDIEAKSSVLVDRTSAASTILGEARHGAHTLRGFAALGLGLALRAGENGAPSVAKFHTDGLGVLGRGFERTKEQRLRAAYAVALGVVGAPASKMAAPLAVVLADRHAAPSLRGHVALSLVQMGDTSKPVRKALRTALWDRRSSDLRSQAALALSYLGGRQETRMLVGELRRASSQFVLGQVAIALGQLGDIDAVPAILEVASDAKRQEQARALAIASLGLLGDPEPRPSLLRLTLDANYPATTDSLSEAFTIL